MSPLHVARIAISARATIPDYAFAQTFSSSLQGLAEQLAQQVHAYVQATGLGYYPPLEYFFNQSEEEQANSGEHGQPGVEPYLLDAVREVAQWADNMGRHEILSALQPVFSSVVIDNLQSIAFTMPGVRFGQQDALGLLVKHFTPNSIKFDMTVTLLQKHQPASGLEKAASHMVLRWLGDPFQHVEVTSARLL